MFRMRSERSCAPQEVAFRASRWVALGAACFALCGLSATVFPSSASAASDPSWWQQRSAAERRSITNYYYTAAGRRAPYTSQVPSTTKVLSHVKSSAPPAARGDDATRTYRTAMRAGIIQTLETSATVLPRVNPYVLAATIVIASEVDLGMYLYSRWTLNMDAPTGSINVSSVQYYPAGATIFFGAKSTGEWLLNGAIGNTEFNPIRWFEPPCTFSGYTAPPPSQLRSGIDSGQTCFFPTPNPPTYEGSSRVYVDVPYVTPDKLKLLDWPVIGPWGSQTYNYGGNFPPTPAPEIVEPKIEEDLEQDGYDDLRHRLLVAIAAESLLSKNAGDPVLTEDQAKAISEECVSQSEATPGMKSSDCDGGDDSQSIPMFVAGGDFPEATAHVKQSLSYGLARGASWWKLRYYQRPDSERSWKEDYGETDVPNSSPPCVGSVADDTACDEWPFLKTEEGATASSTGMPHTLPHLKIINAGQNSSSGSRYSGMVTRCAMQARRDSSNPQYGYGYFIVVAVESAVVQTRGYCNSVNP